MNIHAGVSENICSFLKEVKPLVLYSVEHGIAMEPKKGNGLHVELTWGTPTYFAFLSCISAHLVCDSVPGDSLVFHQENRGSLVFDWENGIALHAMQGNRASFPSEGDISYDFSSCGRNLGYIRELQQGWPSETPLCSARSGLLCTYEGHLRNLNYA